MSILDPPPLLEIVLIVRCHLLELSPSYFLYIIVCTLNLEVVGNSRKPVERPIHYNQLYYTCCRIYSISISSVARFLLYKHIVNINILKLYGTSTM